MKPFLQIKFADGSIYEVPTSIIAQDRAEYYFENNKDEFATIEDAMTDTTELFASDEYEITDWAQNNMNWAEVVPHARMIGYEPPAKDWANADITMHDASAVIEPIGDNEDILCLPLEFAMMRIAQARNICNQIIYHNDEGRALGALVLIQGGPTVVNFYTAGLNRLTEALAADGQPTDAPNNA